MSTEPPDPGDQVAGLAREVETLARQITALTAQLDQQVAAAASTQNRLEQLHTYITRGPQQAGKEGAGAFTWFGFDGTAEDAAVMLERLVQWVRGVYLQYSDARKSLPACWLLHPDIVEELQVLRAAWVHAFGPHARPTDPSDFHDRQRRGVEQRVRIYARSCSADLHHPGVTGGYNPRPTPVAHTELIPAIATWWAEDRDSAPPEPAIEHAPAGPLNSNGRGK